MSTRQRGNVTAASGTERPRLTQETFTFTRPASSARRPSRAAMAFPAMPALGSRAAALICEGLISPWAGNVRAGSEGAALSIQRARISPVDWDFIQDILNMTSSKRADAFARRGERPPADRPVSPVSTGTPQGVTDAGLARTVSKRVSCLLSGHAGGVSGVRVGT